MALAQAAALLMSVAFIIYVLIIAVPFARTGPARPATRGALSWHLFVPALNEEKVIGGTIDYLRAASRGARLGHRRRQRRPDRGHRGRPRPLRPLVHVVSRRLPDAQTGKGRALNDAYRQLRAWLPAADRGRSLSA